MAAQYGQGAVTLRCIVLTIMQFQMETAAHCSMFHVPKTLQFQALAEVRVIWTRLVSSKIRRKQLPAPVGLLCLSEHNLKKGATL